MPALTGFRIVEVAERVAGENCGKLLPQDVADAVTYRVTRHRRVAVNEVLVLAAEQTW